LDWDNGEVYEVGDKVGQLVIIPYPTIELEEVSELSETQRGSDAFGSSGK
jgi:dUTP pyrophosphatase